MKSFDLKLLFKLIHYVKPYKTLFVFTIFVSVLFGIISTLRPILIQHAFDNYIVYNNSQGFLKIVVVIFLCILVEAFLQFIFIYRSNYIAQTIIKELRLQAFSKIIKLPVRYFDTSPTGQLITRVVSDMEAISAVFSQGLLVIFGDIFKMLLVLSFMFFISWRLTLISLICFPFLIIATILFQNYMKYAFIDVRKYLSKINVFVYEHLVGMSIVQVFSQESETFKKFKSLNIKHRDSHVKTVLYFSIFLPIVDVCSAIAMGLIVWYGALNILSEGTVTVGEIIAFILFVNMLFRPLRAIADRFNVLQMGVIAAARVFEVIELPNQVIFNNSSSSPKRIPSSSISFNNVVFSYKKGEDVLNKISFSIDTNKTLAIIGPTGSGKTTIINLIMKWYEIDEGFISINNNNINEIPVSVLRNNIGVVLQDTFFLADTLMNNIKFFNNISNKEVYDAVKKIGLKEFINKFPKKYDYIIGERGAGLSEGEKQLISFLRTYLLNPSYLILDEATSSLDPITESLIQKSIKTLTHNRTSVIIAHRLSTIQHVDKIIVLEKGYIIESGSHDELMKINGKYANYYYQQFIND